MTWAPVASARAITSSPPTTRLSLLASARSMPSPRLAIVEPSPAEPTSAFSTRSQRVSVISSTSPSAPASTVPSGQAFAARAAASSSAIRPTPKALAWSTTVSHDDCAASPATSSSSLRSTTSSAWTPMEPVEPRIRSLRTRPVWQPARELSGRGVGLRRVVVRREALYEPIVHLDDVSPFVIDRDVSHAAAEPSQGDDAVALRDDARQLEARLVEYLRVRDPAADDLVSAAVNAGARPARVLTVHRVRRPDLLGHSAGAEALEETSDDSRSVLAQSTATLT